MRQLHWKNCELLFPQEEYFWGIVKYYHWTPVIKATERSLGREILYPLRSTIKEEIHRETTRSSGS